ncbi:hypothetical protein HJC23_003406 [Cyclotella cryptica]|uniref:Ankyrin repeat protein n=1 Tax=Cyclotella cryptica TaxID=29204 RepID=A0ABD3QT49_9STRA|eukprot:CCRYP_002542-RA/>CCRYP_002542-RA protein AED:0.21 eAED:-0.08 QI:0/0/0/1/1/1/2/0/249
MSSHCLTNEEYAFLCLLLKHIDLRNWQVLDQILRTNPKKFVSVSEAIAKSSQLNGMTILHACIRFDPPPSIVGNIIQLSPFSPGCVDCLNRTPLHIAAAIRANPQSIMILTDACREACAIQDADGRTPLHLACDVHCELFEGEEGVVRAPPSFDVIRYLASASPQSVPLEDECDMSALELAILSGADIRSVKFLMHVTQMQCKSKCRSPHCTFQMLDGLYRSPKGTFIQRKRDAIPREEKHLFHGCTAR